MSQNPTVSIVMGSDSDLETMKAASRVLDEFEVPYEMAITSAHRSPNWTLRYLREAEARGIQVIIAGAGGAAHLAGTLAAHTRLPVIGVPMDSSALDGLDSLLATVQMPGGVPVATMAIGKAGATNAGIFAVQVLAIGNSDLIKKLNQLKERFEKQVEDKSKRLQKKSSSL